MPFVLEVFDLLGWQINSKSHLIPTPKIEFLGMGLDSDRFEYYIIKEKLKKGGVKAIGRKYNVHLDGYNILPLLTGETDKSPRHEIF